MKLFGGHKISFGDKVSDTKRFECCANCKYYKKTSVESKCLCTGQKTSDNCRCINYRQR